jgi:hypothetical protein
LKTCCCRTKFAGKRASNAHEAHEVGGVQSSPSEKEPTQQAAKSRDGTKSGGRSKGINGGGGDDSGGAGSAQGGEPLSSQRSVASGGGKRSGSSARAHTHTNTCMHAVVCVCVCVCVCANTYYVHIFRQAGMRTCVHTCIFKLKSHNTHTLPHTHTTQHTGSG